MTRILVVGILLGILSIVGSVAAAAGPPPTASTPAQGTLTADPYLELATVSTAVPVAVKCPCTVIIGCAYHPEGFDCADPGNCCHCKGSDPAYRLCVYNVQ